MKVMAHQYVNKYINVLRRKEIRKVQTGTDDGFDFKNVVVDGWKSENKKNKNTIVAV